MHARLVVKGSRLLSTDLICARLLRYVALEVLTVRRIVVILLSVILIGRKDRCRRIGGRRGGVGVGAGAGAGAGGGGGVGGGGGGGGGGGRM